MIQIKPIIILAILIVIGLLSSFRVRQESDSPDVSIYKKDASPLVAYGAFVYLNQSCDFCHTFSVEQEAPGMLSLDGVGGKYSDGWLYEYLKQPDLMFISSTKASYKHLENNLLNTETLARVGRKLSWRTLQKEAAQIQTRLLDEGIETEANELIALIAYIQQIPASKEQERRDSIQYQRFMEEQEVWRKMIADSTSILMASANDSANIVNGEQLFRARCSPCHGAFGEGNVGPNLADEYWLYGGQKTDIARSIVFGNPEKGMLPWYRVLTPTQIGELVAYIESIKGTRPLNPKAPQGTKE